MQHRSIKETRALQADHKLMMEAADERAKHAEGLARRNSLRMQEMRGDYEEQMSKLKVVTEEEVDKWQKAASTAGVLS